MTRWENCGGKILNGVCLDCGGLMETSISGTCPRFVEMDQEISGAGWVCPRCQQVNAPWMAACNCPPPSTTWTDCNT